ncbi:MAG: (d)CMP kinase [Candidatus Bipolaricaulota bacterium]|nr:MAG: (d)CMP kinase [Candidatus Bipolaricaulota bacterium]
MHIAIDGPAASGKSSVAKALADHFGFLYLETGRMYRAVALGLSRGIPLDQLRLEVTEAGRFLLNGEDVTDELHTPALDRGSSEVATRRDVRERMVSLQREIAEDRDVVMEGRDIGTVVLPNAEVKIFLDAAPEVRAERRARQRHQRDIEPILEDLRRRDRRDRTRAISPLNPASDAHIIDTSEKALTEVILAAIAWVKERSGKGDTPV